MKKIKLFLFLLLFIFIATACEYQNIEDTSNDENCQESSDEQMDSFIENNILYVYYKDIADELGVFSEEGDDLAFFTGDYKVIMPVSYVNVDAFIQLKEDVDTWYPLGANRIDKDEKIYVPIDVILNKIDEINNSDSSEETTIESNTLELYSDEEYLKLIEEITHEDEKLSDIHNEFALETKGILNDINLLNDQIELLKFTNIKEVSFRYISMIPCSEGVAIIINNDLSDTDFSIYHGSELLFTSADDKAIYIYRTTNNVEIFKIVSQGTELEVVVERPVQFKNKDNKEYILSSFRFDNERPDEVILGYVFENSDEFKEFFQYDNKMYYVDSYISPDNIMLIDKDGTKCDVSVQDQSQTNYMPFRIKVSRGDFPMYMVISGKANTFNFASDHYDRAVSVGSNYFFAGMNFMPGYNALVDWQTPEKFTLYYGQYNQLYYNEGSGINGFDSVLYNDANTTVFAGDIVLDTQKYDTFSLSYGYLKDYENIYAAKEGEIFLKEQANYLSELINALGPLDYDEYGVFITPTIRRVLQIHPWVNKIQKDFHGTVRMWLGGDYRLSASPETYFLISMGISDNLHNVRNKTNYEKAESMNIEIANIDDRYLEILDKSDYLNIPLSEAESYSQMSFFGTGSDDGDYGLARWGKVQYGVLILDMLAYSSSDGEVIDLLQPLGVIRDKNSDGESFSINDFFDALALFTNYNFDNYIEKYIYDAVIYNTDNIQFKGNTLLAFGDYSKENIHLEEDGENIIATGYAEQDTYICFSYSNNIKEVYVNNQLIEDIYFPWYEESAFSVKVPGGEYRIKLIYD